MDLWELSTHIPSWYMTGAIDESVSLYKTGLQIMEGCSKFTSDDPAIETVRTDLAELLNLVER